MQPVRRRRFTALLLALAGLAGVFAFMPASAAEASAGNGLALLQQVGNAWRTQDFRGRFVYVRGNRMDSMQVVHAVIGGVEHERLSHLDNTAAEIIRRGDETICVHPDARLTRLDAAGAAGPFRAFSDLNAGIEKVYAVSNAGQSRVAGRTADFLEVVPRDAHRFGYRLWIDRDSRLPLRYEVVNRKGNALESVEFVDLETGIKAPRELFVPPSGPAARTLTILRAAKAPMPAVAPSWLPAGFRVTGSETQQFGDAQGAVSSVTYSDGLAAFSLFVEKAAADAKPMGRQLGPTVAVSGVLDAGAAGRFQVTLVGEVPPGTAVKIVEGARYTAAGAAREGGAP